MRSRMRVFQPLHLAVGEVEEVAAAAGGVEHAEVRAGGRSSSFRRLSRLGALRSAAVHGSEIVGLTIFMMSTGEVKCAPKAWRSSAVHRVLEERAEDFGLDLGPVGARRPFELDQLVVVQFDAGGLGEEAAVEVAHALEAPAGRGVGRCSSPRTGRRAGRSCRRASCSLRAVGEQVLRQQADVLGEEGDEHLQDEALGERCGRPCA